MCLRVGALCNDAILDESASGWDIIGDPTEGALLAVAGKAGLARDEQEEVQPRLDEIPFESEKQFMVTLHAEDGQRIAYIKGSVEKVLAMCSGIVMAGEELPITDEIARGRAWRQPLPWPVRPSGSWLLPWRPIRSNSASLDPANLAGRLVLIGLGRDDRPAP